MNSNYILFGYNQFATRLEGLRLNLISAIADKLAKLGGIIDFGGWAEFYFDKPGEYEECADNLVISGIKLDENGRPAFYLAPHLVSDDNEGYSAALDGACDFDNLLKLCEQVKALNCLVAEYQTRGDELKAEFIGQIKQTLEAAEGKSMKLTERENPFGMFDNDFNLALKNQIEEDDIREISIDVNGEVILRYTDMMSDDEDEVRSCNMSSLKWNQIEKLAFIYFYLRPFSGNQVWVLTSKAADGETHCLATFGPLVNHGRISLVADRLLKEFPDAFQGRSKFDVVEEISSMMIHSCFIVKSGVENVTFCLQRFEVEVPEWAQIGCQFAGGDMGTIPAEPMQIGDTVYATRTASGEFEHFYTDEPDDVEFDSFTLL